MERRYSRQLIVSDFQLRLVLVHALYFCLGWAALVVVLFAPLVVAVLAPATADEQVRTASVFLELHGRIWLGLFLALALSIVHVATLTHRMAGPLVRFRRVFRDVADGDVSMRVRVRRKDYLHAEAAALDRMTFRLRRRLYSAKGRAARLETALDRLRAAMPAEPNHQAHCALRTVEQQAQLLRRHLNHFRTGPTSSARPGSRRGTSHPARPGTAATTRPGDAPEPGAGSLALAKRGRQRGFTLIELVLVCAVTVTVTAIAVPAYNEALYAARVVSAVAEIRGLLQDIQRWEVLNGRLPGDLAEAGIVNAVDPWGSAYEYLQISGGGKGKGNVRKDHKLNPINSDYDLYSIGRDHSTKTQISNKDSLDDVIRANDGGYVGLARGY